MSSRKRDSEQWIENRPTYGRFSLPLGELWSYRELVWFLAQRDVKARYKQAVLGGAWAIVEPLAGAALLTVVFGRLANVPSDGIPFLLFAFAGFSLWSYVATSVNAARSSLVKNSALISKVYFPRIAAPLASVLPGLINLSVALLLLAVMMIWVGLAPSVAVITAPLFLLGAMIVALGAGTLFAALTVQYRDVEPVVGLLLQLWLFATPVAYATSLVKGPWRWVYSLNPMVSVVDGWRWSLLRGAPLGWEDLLSAVVGGLLLLLGLSVFQRGERRFADVI